MGQQNGGKRKGARRAAPARRRFRMDVFALALGVTVALVAWGYLALAVVGAAACLFVGLLLGGRLLQAVGLTAARTAQAPERPHRH